MTEQQEKYGLLGVIGGGSGPIAESNSGSVFVPAGLPRKETVTRWGQRSEPDVGTRIYFSNAYWSETNSASATKSGTYLGNNEVEVDEVLQ